MKLCKLLFFFIASITIVSCAKDIDTQIDYTDNNEESQTSVYHIPVEKALQSLDAFLQNETRSASNRMIRSIKQVGTSGATKSSLDDVMLYIVNFDNDEGYAILSANRRIPDDVLCVTEFGNLEENDFILEPSSEVAENLYYIDEYGRLQINPECRTSYDENFDDYLIGDFSELADSTLNTRNNFIKWIHVCPVKVPDDYYKV